MIIVESVADLRAAVAECRGRRERIGFVPTMGSLHAGHVRLVQEARRHAGAVVASIYVNPLQFGENEDFEGYPRTPDQDRALLEAQGVRVLFRPTEQEIYPRGADAQTAVDVPHLSDILCGRFRPGHFRGVTTVVNRLFNLIQPDVAVFGKKDYQQWVIIKTMVADLGMPLDIVGVDTVREPDGLAMSSRNVYLSPSEREIAPKLYESLRTTAERIQKSARIEMKIEASITAELKAVGFRPDYVAVRRRVDLAEPVESDGQLVILAAAWLGRARLIDSVEMEAS
jgi:pantoate--beta-alanine ligase